MSNGVVGKVIENQVAEMGVRIETTEVGFAEIHEDLLRVLVIACVLEIRGLGNRVPKWIVRIFTGQYGLHPKLRAQPFGDDRLGPFFDRLIFLAPVVFLWLPYAFIPQLQRYEAERRWTAWELTSGSVSVALPLDGTTGETS